MNAVFEKAKRFIYKNARIFDLGCRIACDAVRQLFSNGRGNDMHTTACYIRLIQYCEKAGISALFDMSKLRDTLISAVMDQVTKDIGKWGIHIFANRHNFYLPEKAVFLRQ